MKEEKTAAPMLNKNSIWDKSKDVQGTRACGINTMGEKVRKGTAGLAAAGQSGCLCKIVQICLRLSPIVDGRLFLFTIQQKRMGLTILYGNCYRLAL